jgi:hypothetical protein
VTWVKHDVPVPMEAVAGTLEMRGVIRDPHPGKPSEQGYDFRFSFRRPPTVPGEDTPIEHTPWMFVSAPTMEQIVTLMVRYMRTEGHLSPGEAPPPGQTQ